MLMTLIDLFEVEEGERDKEKARENVLIMMKMKNNEGVFLVIVGNVKKRRKA